MTPKKNKIVLNTCYGGFVLSDKALKFLEARGCAVQWGPGEFAINYLKEELPRHHPLLVECVETLGKDAFGFCSKLEVCEIEGNCYKIGEYDGYESILTPESLDWVVIE